MATRRPSSITLPSVTRTAPVTTSAASASCSMPRLNSTPCCAAPSPARRASRHSLSTASAISWPARTPRIRWAAGWNWRPTCWRWTMAPAPHALPCAMVSTPSSAARCHMAIGSSRSAMVIGTISSAWWSKNWVKCAAPATPEKSARHWKTPHPDRQSGPNSRPSPSRATCSRWLRPRCWKRCRPQASPPCRSAPMPSASA